GWPGRSSAIIPTPHCGRALPFRVVSNDEISRHGLGLSRPHNGKRKSTMQLTLSTWTLPIPLLAACLLVNCGLREDAKLGDDSAPLQEGDDDDTQTEPTPCGDALCGAGEYCCNASCSTCVKEGEACTLALCESTEYEPCAGKACGAECTSCAPG